MNKNTKVMVVSLITNIFLALIKIVGGIIGKSSALLADGIHSMSDFATDIFAIIGSYLSNKPADKEHPYGHGKIEYLVSIFIGVVIIFLGLTIIKSSFQKEIVVPSLIVIIVSFFTIFLKYLLSNYVIKKGKEYNSSILLSSGKESKSDVLSSIVVFISILLMHLSNIISIFKYADMIATILVGILILKIGFEVLLENSRTILGQVETNPEIIDKIKDIILSDKSIKEIKKFSLLKFGNCYNLSCEVGMDPNINLKNAHNILDIIEYNIKVNDKKIKYITIHAYPYMK